MKKTAFLIVLALLLSGCTVGPEERPQQTLASPAETLPESLPAETTAAPVTEPVADITDDSAETGPVGEATHEDAPGGDEPYEPENVDDISGEEIEVDPVDVGTLYATISLNVREGPSTDYDSIGYLDPGEGANILGYNYDYGWYLIEYGDGTGWVSGNYMAEMPAEEPDNEIAYEAVELDMNEALELLKSFAEYSGVRNTSALLDAYYGDYENGKIAAFSIVTGDGVNNEAGEITVDGHKIKLPDGNSVLYLISGGDFIELNSAYERGLVTEGDLDKLSYISEITQYLGLTLYDYEVPDDQQYPQMDPLDHAMAATICDDYARSKGLDSNEVSIAQYLGNYSGGQAVVMIEHDKEYTDDLQYLSVAGCQITLASGSYELTIHTSDGKFVPISDAYEQGIISDSDVMLISYYSNM